MSNDHLSKKFAPQDCLLVVVATFGLACFANCQGTKGQQPPQEPAVGAAPTPAATNGGAQATTLQATTQPSVTQTAMTEQELQQCIADCGQSQQDHPEEAPYDCRETCLQRQIVQ
jgi:hypothetical protein